MSVLRSFRKGFAAEVARAGYWRGAGAQFLRPAAIPFLIYVLVTLAINVWFLGGLLVFIAVQRGVEFTPEQALYTQYAGGAFISFILFLLSLSPIGEWVLRCRVGARKLRPDERAYLEPMFRRVYDKMLEKHPGLPRNIRLFINRSEDDFNAFACGIKTICVTQGFYTADMPEAVKEGVLAHEFGHLAHHDTTFLQVLQAGEMIVSLAVWLFGTIAILVAVFAESAGQANSDNLGGMVVALLAAIARFTLLLVIQWGLKIWFTLGMWVLRLASRDAEYRADAEAGQLGYGDALADGLEMFDGGARPGTLFALLEASHPPTYKRVQRLRCFGSGAAVMEA